MALIAGTKFDSYEVLSLLGAGGMGEVYRARDPVLKRQVAIKVLPSYVSQDSQRLHRFEQEAQAAAAGNLGLIEPVSRKTVLSESGFDLCGGQINVLIGRIRSFQKVWIKEQGQMIA